MSLPANFSGSPNEDLHRDFRNLCMDIKNKIKTSKDPNELEWEIERFVDASKQMNWHHKSSDVFKKEEGDKTTHKVYMEFKRYVNELKFNKAKASTKDLLDAFSELEKLIQSYKVT